MNIEMLFLTIIDMSISASMVICFVLIARFLLKRMPRIFSYVLWSAVLVQLLCPVAIESSIGILPSSNLEVSKQVQEYAFDDIALDWNNRDFQKNFLQVDHGTGEFELQSENTILKGLAILWVVGMVCMLAHSGMQVMRLQKRLRTAIPLETDQHVYLVDDMETAFVFGLLRPRIYLPSHIEGEERAYILAHEQYHIRRLDYVIRCMAFVALAVHWFNPLVWLAFMLAGRDMEMSCDEAVVKTLNVKLRKDYANSLLTMGASIKKTYTTPIAFGVCDTKRRIQHVLHYKTPKWWIMVLVMPIVLLMIVVVSTTATEKIMVDENGFAVVDLVDKRQDGVVMMKESMETYQYYCQEEYGNVNATEFINSIIVPEGMQVQPYKVYGEIDIDDTQLYYGGYLLVLCEGEEPISFIDGSTCGAFTDTQNGDWSYKSMMRTIWIQDQSRAMIATRGQMEQVKDDQHYITETFDVDRNIDLPGTVSADYSYVRQAYAQLEDGTWKSGDYIYQYKLELTGRLSASKKDITYIILSNTEDITFDEAWKAEFSSNTMDFFDKEEAVIVESILQ